MAEPIQICCISFNYTDRLRLIGMPPQMYDGIRAAISDSFAPIQNETTNHGSYEFKLKGNPWVGQSDESVKSRALLVSILTHMAQQGWNLIQSADTSKRGDDKDTMFFEMGQPDLKPQMFGLSFNIGDRIRLINVPEEMKNILLTAVSAHIPVQSQRDYCGSFQLKLSGSPWYYSASSGAIASRLMLCRIIANFRAVGYKLYASTDISGVNLDLESWVFRKVSSPIWQEVNGIPA